MRTPTIEHHEFRPPKDMATGNHDLAALAVAAVPPALTGLLGESGSWYGAVVVAFFAVLAVLLV